MLPASLAESLLRPPPAEQTHIPRAPRARAPLVLLPRGDRSERQRSRSPTGRGTGSGTQHEDGRQAPEQHDRAPGSTPPPGTEHEQGQLREEDDDVPHELRPLFYEEPWPCIWTPNSQLEGRPRPKYKLEKVALADIYFSQDSISSCFNHGAFPLLLENNCTTRDLLEIVQSGRRPLCALKWEGRYYSLNNRRLYVLKNVFSPSEQVSLKVVELSYTSDTEGFSQLRILSGDGNISNSSVPLDGLDKIGGRVTSLMGGVDVAVVPPNLDDVRSGSKLERWIRLEHKDNRDRIRHCFDSQKHSYFFVKYRFFFDHVVLSSDVPAILERVAGAIQGHCIVQPLTIERARRDMLCAHVAMHVYGVPWAELLSRSPSGARHISTRSEELSSLVQHMPKLDEEAVLEMYAQAIAECPTPAKLFETYAENLDLTRLEQLCSELWSPTRIPGITVSAILDHTSPVFSQKTCLHFLLERVIEAKQGTLFNNLLALLSQLVLPQTSLKELLPSLLRLLAAVDDSMHLDEEVVQRVLHSVLGAAGEDSRRATRMLFDTVVTRDIAVQVQDARLRRILHQFLTAS